MVINTLCSIVLFLSLTAAVDWNKVPCNEAYFPENCDRDGANLATVEDFERCAPALLPISVRNYFVGAAGRRITYDDNEKAFTRIKIMPKLMRDISRNSLRTTVLGREIAFPIGMSPVAQQRLAHPDGELATAAVASAMNTVMILSSISTSLIEDVARAARSVSESYHLWMQVYIFQNRSITVDIIKRAERMGFEAIVVTVDTPIDATLSCDARRNVELPNGIGPANIPVVNGYPTSLVVVTPKDISWLKRLTDLPVVAKGILSGPDAITALRAGASAILVSNHGGRQLDSVPAAIDALPGVVDAVNKAYRGREVYMDGGVRNGLDVYKALALGARAVFVGKPQIWGLTVGGSSGVQQVMTILRTEFNETMLLAGSSCPDEIERTTILGPIKRSG